MNERMSDDTVAWMVEWATNLIAANGHAPPHEFHDVVKELKRARAAEAALLAEREGMTGAPTHAGVYRCERREGWYTSMIWDGLRWRSNNLALIEHDACDVTRYWRLPGEEYTESKA